MRMSHLQQIESAIPKLFNIDLPIRLAYQLNVLLDDIKIHLTRLHEFRDGFIVKFGEPVEGGYRVKTDKLKEFDEGMAELLSEEIDVQPIEVPLSLLMDSPLKLTVLEIESLKISGFLLDDISKQD